MHRARRGLGRAALVMITGVATALGPTGALAATPSLAHVTLKQAVAATPKPLVGFAVSVHQTAHVSTVANICGESREVKLKDAASVDTQWNSYDDQGQIGTYALQVSVYRTPKLAAAAMARIVAQAKKCPTSWTETDSGQHYGWTRHVNGKYAPPGWKGWLVGTYNTAKGQASDYAFDTYLQRGNVVAIVGTGLPRSDVGFAQLEVRTKSFDTLVRNDLVAAG